MFALTQFLAGLGLNVLAGVLQAGYQGLLSAPMSSDLDSLKGLAQRISEGIAHQPGLRRELTSLLDTTDALQIAKQIARGDPAVHGWLLARVFEEVQGYRGEFGEIRRALAELQESMEGLSGAVAAKRQPFFSAPPVPAQGIFGRERDLTALRRLLDPTKSTCQDGPVSVLGMAGIGKSTLAIGLGHAPAIRILYPDGVLWTELGPKPNITSRLVEFGEGIGVDVSPLLTNEARSARLRSALHERRVLVIVDDVWDAAHGLLFRLEGMGSRTIYTTRELPIANDLSTPHRIYRLRGLTPQASLKLLKRLSPEAVTQDQAAAKELCRRLEFHPLGITLAGRFLANEALTRSRRTMMVQTLISDADQRLTLHQPDHRLGIEEARPSLRAVLALSVDRLERVEQERFAMLSVFGSDPLTWEIPAASYVWECNEEEAEQTITHLVQRGLVEERQGQYRLHALFADYARILRAEWDL